MTTESIILATGGWLIAALLAVNVFFVRDFMRRIESSIKELNQSLIEYSTRLMEVDKNVTEKIVRMDEQIAEINRLRKNGGKDIWR